jgi:hypothetical protein
MDCPTCKRKTAVIATYLVKGERQRKRSCSEGHVIYTEEKQIEYWDHVDPRAKNPGIRGPRKPKATIKLPPRKILGTAGDIKVTPQSPGWLKRVAQILGKPTTDAGRQPANIEKNQE